ncbi:hypothetical protein BGI39_07965 [Snodgrassella communis]|uniref:Uncharacterized protein n=1 Tax=Snodgrassella communis TaxID=2946699 RepID=A0A836Z3K3_9NEIS|nr:hypothetical protein SALWKB12_1055 [Snodgrassella communis]KDN15472.1 hypothetical protein SALWKB29_0576 [Snodgrassella communis]PIT25957.1 hypothetical protein BGI38_09045 [Snodgrassella communis]PIT27705.1 hypothetical protein BGI39_07965 [Snodgrassella communis]
MLLALRFALASLANALASCFWLNLSHTQRISRLHFLNEISILKSVLALIYSTAGAITNPLRLLIFLYLSPIAKKFSKVINFKSILANVQ